MQKAKCLGTNECPREQRRQTTADANVGNDRTTHEANTVAEAHSALQAENQKLFEYAQSLQQHVDQFVAASRENDASMLALQHRVDAMNAKKMPRPRQESNAALQQERLAEGEWEVKDTYTANHVQAMVAQMEEERTIQAAGYQAHQAVLARETQEVRNLDERTHICAVLELTKMMSEMRGEWEQLKGTMANSAESGASQGGYVKEKPPRDVAPQRTDTEEALLADREEASSRDPRTKPWVTDPEAASTRAPSTDKEKDNEKAHHSGFQKAYGCQKKAKHNQVKQVQEESGQADRREPHAKMVGHGRHRHCPENDVGHSFHMEILLAGERGHESFQRCDVLPGAAPDVRTLEPTQDARNTRQ